MSAAAYAGVEGWLTDAQARRLAGAAAEVEPGGRIVEIGSYRGRSTIALAEAAPDGVEIVAIDPHLGRDRAPQQKTEDADAGAADLVAFRENLERAGVAGRVRHLRLRSEDALAELPGDVSMLYVDGAHSLSLARLDIGRWGARVRPGGLMLVHDSFSSVGVTAALATTTAAGPRWRYLGRTGSLAAFRREDLRGAERAANLVRQAAELPWFVRNVVVKALLLAGLGRVARALGHREGPWPF